MFRTIVGALILVEIGIPLILWLFSLACEDKTVGCIIFGLAFLVLILILG